MNIEISMEHDLIGNFVLICMKNDITHKVMNYNDTG